MASCLLCVSLKVDRATPRFTTQDEAQSHATQHFRQMQLFDGDCCINLDQVVEQCFPNFTVRPLMKRKKRVINDGRQSLLNLCHTLFDGRISKASPRVACQKCGTGVVLYHKTKGCSNFFIAINHAATHLGLDLFECLKCGRSCRSKAMVRQHLVSFHCVRGLSEYYTDKSDNFLGEITASITECFSEKCGSSDQRECMISLRNETHVRSTTSNLAAERQLFCYQRIRQLAGADGKVQCRLCPKSICVKIGNGYMGRGAMEHALVHLKEPLFRCKVCSLVHSCRSSMHKHLKLAHALPLLKNFECLADEFHNGIMSMLQKCYAAYDGK